MLRRFPAASRGACSLFDQAVVSATSFATAIIINRSASPDQVGLYYLATSILIVAIGVQDNVIASPYTIYSKRYHGRDLAEYAGSAWLHYLALTALGMIVLLTAILGLSVAGAVNIAPALWALLGAGPLLLLREAIRRFSFANLVFTSALLMDCSIAATQLAGLLLLSHFGKLSILTIYGVMGCSCTLACVGWYLLYPQSVRFEWRRFVPDWKRNWAFARWALRSYLVGNTSPYLMTWIINFAVGTAAAGVLGACGTLIGITNVLLSGVDRVLMPRSAQAFVVGGVRDLRRVLMMATWLLLFALVPFCFLLFAVGDRIAVAVYGSQFEGCGPILTVLATSAMMSAVGMVAGIGLWAVEQPQSNLVADVVSLLVTLAFAAMLVVTFGALGAALATLAGTTTAAVVRTATLLRVLDSFELASNAVPAKACVAD